MARHLRFIGLLLLVSMACSTWVFWTYEHGLNPRVQTYTDALWWWFVSSTTVGYGDVAPVTGMGRLVGVVTIVIGIYGYTNFIAITADSLHSLTNQKRLGTSTVKARDHVVICEYTAFADELIQALGRYPELSRREIVILTDLVKVRPYPQHHFVRGVPLSPDALKQANVAAAACIFVFANARFQDPDLKTLHIVSRIQKVNPAARIFVEMVDPASPLLAHLGPAITVLSSRELLESILKNKTIDLDRYFPDPRT
jgi:voltage-gated potassium channel